MEYQIPIPEGDGEIPALAPILNQNQEAPEIKPYKISFDDKYYKEKECEAHSMKKENAAYALKIIRDVGVFFMDKGYFLTNTLKDAEIKHIARSENKGYQKLYRGMEDEESVYEIKYVRKNKEVDLDFRIYFALNDTDKVFHVIAIRQSHYPTDK